MKMKVLISLLLLLSTRFVAAENPTWDELRKFLTQDDTDEKPYIVDVFECGEFAEQLRDRAIVRGWKVGFASIDLEDEVHILNVFETQDHGTIFIDNTQSDTVAYIQEGMPYGTVPISAVKEELIVIPSDPIGCSFSAKDIPYNGRIFDYNFYEEHRKRIKFYSDSYEALMLDFEKEGWLDKHSIWNINLGVLRNKLGGALYHKGKIVNKIRNIDWTNGYQRIPQLPLKDPTWVELKSFLERDDTEKAIDPSLFEASLSAARHLRDRARSIGLRCGLSRASLTSGRVTVKTIFHTIDRGVIFIDPLSYDGIAYMKKGEPSGTISLTTLTEDLFILPPLPEDMWTPLKKQRYSGSIFDYEYFKQRLKTAEFFNQSIFMLQNAQNILHHRINQFIERRNQVATPISSLEADSLSKEAMELSKIQDKLKLWEKNLARIQSEELGTHPIHLTENAVVKNIKTFFGDEHLSAP